MVHVLPLLAIVLAATLVSGESLGAKPLDDESPILQQSHDQEYHQTPVERQKSTSELTGMVKNDLEILMEQLPTLEITPASLLAQRGPIKPNSIPLPKPGETVAPLPKPVGEILELNADRQEYDVKQQRFIAIGKVRVRYSGSILEADRVEIDTKERTATALGNVLFVRGDQRLRGTRLVYNYGQAKGVLENAAGTINTGTFGQTIANTGSPNSQSLIVGVGGTEQGVRGRVGRLGFLTDRLTLENGVWQVENLRVTNDPFSPPEMELRADKATITPISSSQERLDLASPRLIFDNGFSLPVPVGSITLDRFTRLTPVVVGFDQKDRGGLFYQQSFDVVTERNLNFQIAPQLLLQRAFEGKPGGLGFDLIGLLAILEGDLGDGQSLSMRASISGLDFSNLENNLRMNVRYQIPIFQDHSLVTQYAYRDRAYNGSLGFQDVSNLVGVNVISPARILGNSGWVLNYQGGMQLINATRADFSPNQLGTLGRWQVAASVERGFPLWRGQGLPAERTSGMKYTPEPLIPRLDGYLRFGGVYAFYSNAVDQASLAATVGLSAAAGSLSKDFLDYTQLDLSFTQQLISGQSPFLFDRIVDTQVLTAGILQQIYGPFRFGIQQSWSLSNNGRLVDSVYTLQYDRRTYAVVLRYNPTQGLGELSLRISDFNWFAPPSGVNNVQSGMSQR
ncbi:MAG: DUF3769 domain-containing protein [Pseudanabaena sp. ELA607]